MVATNDAIEGKNKGIERKNNRGFVTGAYLAGVEDVMMMVDGTLRPAAVVEQNHRPLDIDELLPAQFIQNHSPAEDAEEFFAPYTVENRSDLLTLPESVDDHVAYKTEFDGLAQLLEAAVEERIQ